MVYIESCNYIYKFSLAISHSLTVQNWEKISYWSTVFLTRKKFVFSVFCSWNSIRYLNWLIFWVCIEDLNCIFSTGADTLFHIPDDDFPSLNRNRKCRPISRKPPHDYIESFTPHIFFLLFFANERQSEITNREMDEHQPLVITKYFRISIVKDFQSKS